MLDIEIAKLLHQFGMFTGYFVIFMIIWFTAIIYNNIRWKKTVIDYANHEVQLILARQEHELKTCYATIDRQSQELSNIKLKSDRQRALYLKLMELLNNENIHA